MIFSIQLLILDSYLFKFKQIHSNDRAQIANCSARLCKPQESGCLYIYIASLSLAQGLIGAPKT